MRDRLPRRAALALMAAVATAAALPGVASATLTPSLTLTPSTVTAGATRALVFDLAFSASTFGDSVKDFTIALPAGVLANANLNGGACLNSGTPAAGCELGSGTATVAGLALPARLSLVGGPTASDIAGAALVIGVVTTTADIVLRTTPDVGLNLSFKTLPPSLTDLKLTLSAVRAPASCPSTPATVAVSADPMTGSAVATAAPLTVTGCGSLPYAPTLAASVAKDAGDSGATVVAAVTQAAGESSSRTIEFDLPSSISPNLTVAAACLLTSSCPVGTASATSPLLPSSAFSHGTLTLGGSIVSPTLSVTFPAPYGVSLTGAINTSANSVTFNNVPDVPLTNFTVNIGGTSAGKAFSTSCAASVFAGQLTPWDGAATQTLSAPITYTGCPSSTKPPTNHSGRPTTSGASLSGLVKERAKLVFTAHQGRGANPIKTIAVRLPRGIRFTHEKKGIVVRGPGGKKLKFGHRVSHGVLTITLSSAASRAQVTLESPAISVSTGRAKSVKSELKRKRVSPLRFTVKVTDSGKTRTKLTLKLKPKS